MHNHLVGFVMSRLYGARGSFRQSQISGSTELLKDHKLCKANDMLHTVNILNICTSEKFAVIILKFEQCGSTTE